MKRLYITVFIISMAAVIRNSYGWDSTAASFFPLNTGNKWVFWWYSTQWGQSGRFSVTLNQLQNINNHTYYNYRYYWLRVDSVNGNVMEYTTNQGCPWSVNERMRDSLSAKLYDTVRYYCNSGYRTLADTNQRTLFGSYRSTKNFRLGNNGIIYAKNFGVMELYSQSGMVFYVEQLAGCIIDGVLYGDTSLTGINLISEEVPKEYSLYQNYPNPFNPTTKIKFDIPNKVGLIYQISRLEIYNTLGQLIKTLVNESLSPGTYEVEFDGTNYPSGIYYYQLSSDGYKETKKMCLIK